MKLLDVIDTYVSLQQSLGKRFESTQRLLRRFARQVGDVHIDKVRAQKVSEFLRGTGPLSATWALKYRVLSGLYRFAISRGFANGSPLPTAVPALPPQQKRASSFRRDRNASSSWRVPRYAARGPSRRPRHRG